MRYPAAGTANAVVELHVLALDGGSIDVAWDHDRFPYLTAVHWVSSERLLLAVQSRDQRDVQVLEAEPDDGRHCRDLRRSRRHVGRAGAGRPGRARRRTLGHGRRSRWQRRLLIDGEPVTPTDLQVRAVAAVRGNSVMFHANRPDDATVQDVWEWSDDGLDSTQRRRGVHTAVVGGPTTVLRSVRSIARRPSTQVVGGPALDVVRRDTRWSTRTSRCITTASDRLATAVLLPHDHDGSPLPVLLDPVRRPARAARAGLAQSVLRCSQWFADQGFAVVIADGRGTPGRGSDWERAVHLDLATPVLDDQVDALHAAAERLSRSTSTGSAIRGWSFGGYLAALAVLRRPDVFHAAVAGAPVTDWRLYDTHYTERYLGDPTVDDTEPYDRLVAAAAGRRADPAAAADPRPRRRQRRRRAHPAAVVRAAGRRQAARGAAARRASPT